MNRHFTPTRIQRIGGWLIALGVRLAFGKTAVWELTVDTEDER